MREDDAPTEPTRLAGAGTPSDTLDDAAGARGPRTGPWQGPTRAGARVDAVPRDHAPPAANTDRYEQVDLLAEGGMGQVFIGRDPHLRRRVAYKALKPEISHRGGARRRFLVEMQVLAQLEHPAILPLYAAETDVEGGPAFSMKYVDGGTLGELLRAAVQSVRRRGEGRGRHALDRRLDLFVRVCEGVHHAHERGVLHRDLKPENIMLGRHREVYVSDWGLARVVGAAEAAGDDLDAGGPAIHTRYGSMMGTMAYVAPEQAAGDLDALGPWTDQFSLGLMLYEVVCLRRARPPELTSDRLREMAMDGAYAPVRHALGLPVAPALRAIIAKACAPDPADRYPSVEALAEDVRRVLRREETVALPDRGLRRVLRWVALHPTGAVAALGAVLLSLSLVAAGGIRQAYVAERAAHARAVRLADLAREVTVQAGSLDRMMADVVALVQGLAVEVRTLLDADRPAAVVPWLAPDRFDAPPWPAGTADDARYGMPVTFDHAVALVAPGADPAATARSAAVLAPLDDTFVDLMLASEDRALLALPRDARRAQLRSRTPPVHVTYLGLEDGLLLNYPGYGKFDAAYDPRRRPWYAQSIDATGPVWGAPYPDVSGSGVLVPCNLPVRDDRGTLRGVVGADMVLDAFAARLGRPDLPGFVETSVLADDGTVIGRSDARTGRVDLGLNDNRALERAPFPVAPIREAVVAGVPGGTLVGDDRLFAYQRLVASGWTLVVEVDRATWERAQP